MARVSIRDVAAMAAVSVGTVSNYLNHPQKVSSDKAERIRRAIDATGFVPNSAGRQLRLGRSRLIGYLAPDVSNPHFAEIAEAVERRADERGLTVFLANSHGSRAREDAYLAAFEEHRVRGMIVSSHVPIDDRLAAARVRGTPSVLTGQLARRPDQPSVSIDDVVGGRLVAEHLVAQGASRIAFVGGPLGVPQVADRLAGASAAVREATGASLEVIEIAERTIAGGRAAASALLARDRLHRPDAVFAVNDLMALGVLNGLTLGGVSVPSDIAIVGYDDNEFAASSLVPLTSVRGQTDGYGSAVLDLLWEVLEGCEIENPHRVFRPELVVRESSMRV